MRMLKQSADWLICFIIMCAGHKFAAGSWKKTPVPAPVGVDEHLISKQQ